MPVQNQYQPVSQGGVFFDLVSSDMAAINYLVSPGNTVYLFDQQNRVFYEKTFNSFQAFDLVAREISQPQTEVSNQNGLTKDEILALIRTELQNYNPHVPRKDRRQ